MSVVTQCGDEPLTEEEPLTLLPPSAFEKPRTSVPGGQRDGQLKKVTEEISALKIENQKLKDRLDGSVWEMASGTTSHQNRRTAGLPAIKTGELLDYQPSKQEENCWTDYQPSKQEENCWTTSHQNRRRTAGLPAIKTGGK
ncbi:hypothetical protein ACOMHN_001892 [Nucella lapillus]